MQLVRENSQTELQKNIYDPPLCQEYHGSQGHIGHLSGHHCGLHGRHPWSWPSSPSGPAMWVQQLPALGPSSLPCLDTLWDYSSCLVPSLFNFPSLTTCRTTAGPVILFLASCPWCTMIVFPVEFLRVFVCLKLTLACSYWNLKLFTCGSGVALFALCIVKISQPFSKTLLSFPVVECWLFLTKKLFKIIYFANFETLHIELWIATILCKFMSK